MYICNRCGNNIIEGKRFCNQCGEPVRYWDPQQLRADDPVPMPEDDTNEENADEELILDAEDESYDDADDFDSKSVGDDDKKDRTDSYRILFSEEDDDIDEEDDRNLQTRRSAHGNTRRSVSIGRRKSAENRAINKILFLVVPLILIIAIVCCFILGMRYQQSCNQKLSTFNAEIKAYKEVLGNYSEVESRYTGLLEMAEEAFEAKDYGDFEHYSQEMADAKVALIKEYESETKLIDLKTTYVEKLKNFKIQDVNKKNYDSLMKRLQDAIDAKDATEYGQFAKELEALEAAIRTENDNMVQSLRNEIAKIDLSHAGSADLQVFDTYWSESNQAIEEDNYILALEILNKWRTEAKKLDNKLSESESREIAQSIAESKAKAESESRAKAESESKAKAESESSTESSAADNNVYILPDSSTRYLEPEEVAGLSSWELYVARNEIYARHGRRFYDQSLQTYFDSQAWYHGTIDPASFDDSSISAVESYNAELIKAYE